MDGAERYWIKTAIEALEAQAFTIECVAHLQGKEKLLLPQAEHSRKLATMGRELVKLGDQMNEMFGEGRWIRKDDQRVKLTCHKCRHQQFEKAICEHCGADADDVYM